jgi:hypothetical protein
MAHVPLSALTAYLPVPSTSTAAPATGYPSWSVTVPDRFNLFWANTETVRNNETAARKKQNSVFLIVVIIGWFFTLMAES